MFKIADEELLKELTEDIQEFIQEIKEKYNNMDISTVTQDDRKRLVVDISQTQYTLSLAAEIKEQFMLSEQNDEIINMLKQVYILEQLCTNTLQQLIDTYWRLVPDGDLETELNALTINMERSKQDLIERIQEDDFLDKLFADVDEDYEDELEEALYQMLKIPPS